jgi:beta-1,4-N-acetylglucosaminyltransferase
VSTFVSVGNASQPYSRLLEAVCEIAPQLPQPVFVQFGAAQSFACSACAGGVAFLDMEEFAKRVADAELLILHAGAGSVIHAVRAGKIPIVIPRRASLGEHVDDHQMEFARELEKAGKVFVAHDAATLMQAVDAVIQGQKLLDNKAVCDSTLVEMVSNVLAKTASKCRR